MELTSSRAELASRDRTNTSAYFKGLLGRDGLLQNRGKCCEMLDIIYKELNWNFYGVIACIEI
jgi:hypothetical protein